MRTLVALALALSFAAPALRQDEERRDRIPPPVSKRTREDFQKLLTKMQGGWQLVEMRAARGNSTSRFEVGYLVISQDFMSVEFHMGFYNRQLDTMDESYFQSGTYRLRPDERGYVETQTLIGSFLDDLGDLAFEPPGILRTYAAEVIEDQLILVRTLDATRFVFERLLPSKDFDFYGRPLPPPEEEAGEGERKEAEPPRRRGGR